MALFGQISPNKVKTSLACTVKLSVIISVIFQGELSVWY